MTSLLTRWHTSIREIPEDAWSLLLGDNSIPFYSWKWLFELECSGSISSDNGWQPMFLSVWRDEDLVAIAPLYLKSNSFGEFVFDQAFARLAFELGLSYYPKLVGMSPFSPVEGYKFYFADGENKFSLTKFMMESIDRFAHQNNILSCNFLHVDPSWRKIAEASGCAVWLNQHSYWKAEQQNSFSDYLALFNSNQRRNIKRERKSVCNAGVQISISNGDQLHVTQLRQMYSFYLQHAERWGAWGNRYLSQSFFEELAQPWHRNQVVLFIANLQDEQEPLAMSLCINDGKKLWGRYWGSREDMDSLHFELCYYSPITWALKNGIKSFDPGSGGAHKLRRGFFLKPHASLHRWYNPRIDGIIRPWLVEVNRIMLEEITQINSELPFRFDSFNLDV